MTVENVESREIVIVDATQGAVYGLMWQATYFEGICDEDCLGEVSESCRVGHQ